MTPQSAEDQAVVSQQPGLREFVALMALIMAMIALAIDSMIPALGAIGNSLNVPHANDRQYVIAGFMIGFGVGQVFIGTLSDRFGRRPVLLVSICAYILFSMAAALATSFELLIAARAAQGVAAAGGRVLVVSIVRDRYAGRQMARVMSLAFIVFLAAPVIAPGVGQLILAVAPWRWIFVALAGVGVVMAIWVATRLPETLPPERRITITPANLRRSYKRVTGDRQSNGYTAASAWMMGAMTGFLNSVQQVFDETFSAPHLLAPVFALMAGLMAIGSLLNSRLVVRLGMRWIGHWAMIAFTAIAGFHAALAAAGYETLITFAVLQAVMMGCFALATANFGALAMENLGDVAGTASSLQGAFSALVGALIGIVIGQQFDGTTIPLYTGFFLCGVGTIVTVLITERGRLFRKSG